MPPSPVPATPTRLHGMRHSPLPGPTSGSRLRSRTAPGKLSHRTHIRRPRARWRSRLAPALQGPCARRGVRARDGSVVGAAVGGASGRAAVAGHIYAAVDHVEDALPELDEADSRAAAE